MRKRLALLGAVLLMYAAPAAADSFVLRPPSALDLDFEGHGFGFWGDGFSAVQDSPMFGLAFTTEPKCDPCRAGDVWNPSFTATDVFMGTGSATINGETFAGVAYRGDLSFAAVPVIFPSTAASGIQLATPFSFTGTLRGFNGSALAFSADLTGVGIGRRFFDLSGENDGFYFASENRMTYTFTESAAATPEPASLLLIGTGLAGFAARKRLTRASPSR